MASRTASEPRSGCPLNAAVEVIGDRWSLLVRRHVMFATGGTSTIEQVPPLALLGELSQAGHDVAPRR